MVQTEEKNESVPACIEQIRKTRLVDEEFAHTRKRLSRAKVFPLLQFTVYAHGCTLHGEPDGAHLGFNSVGSETQVPGGIQFSISAVEQLLAALKAKLQ